MIRNFYNFRHTDSDRTAVSKIISAKISPSYQTGLQRNISEPLVLRFQLTQVHMCGTAYPNS